MSCVFVNGSCGFRIPVSCSLNTKEPFIPAIHQTGESLT